MYDFYVALEKLTNNTGIKPSTRYSEFLRMTRQYRHLLLLKRAGRAHDPSGIFGTQRENVLFFVLLVRDPV